MGGVRGGAWVVSDPRPQPPPPPPEMLSCSAKLWGGGYMGLRGGWEKGIERNLHECFVLRPPKLVLVSCVEHTHGPERGVQPHRALLSGAATAAAHFNCV